MADTKTSSNGKAAKGGSVGSEVGLTGLIRSNQGTVEEEFLPTLQGREAIKVYKEMRENDPVVGGVMFAIDMLCRGVEWDVEDHPDGSEEDAQFLKECMEDMAHSWSDFISEVMSMLTYGWSWFEIVYKRRSGPEGKGSSSGSTSDKNEDDTGNEDVQKIRKASGTAGSRFSDGKVGWRKFAIRSQDSLDRWVFDDGSGVEGMIQKPPPDYTERTIPIEKSLLFRTSAHKGNPEGRSILRSAYYPWFNKKWVERNEAIGIERDLAGIPMAEVDGTYLRDDASDEDKAVVRAIEKIVTNLKRDREEGIVWPLVFDEQGNQMFRLSLLNSGGSRTFDTDRIIQRHDQRIAMTVLADFLLLGHEKVGSFALSSDKTDLFAIAIGAWLKSIEDVLNRYAVPRLFALNGMGLENLPQIKHGDIETPPLADIASYISSLVGAGVPLFPDENLEKHLRKIANLPEKSEEAIKQQEELAQQQEEQKQAQLEAMQDGGFGGEEEPMDDEDSSSEQPQQFAPRRGRRKRPNQTVPGNNDAPDGDEIRPD